MATTTVTTETVNAAQRHQVRTAGHDPIDHQHGEMEVRAHERTYNGFIRALVWNVVAIIAVLLFLLLANS